MRRLLKRPCSRTTREDVSWCYRGYVVAGDPDAVCEQVAAYFDAGLDGMVFNMHDAQDLGPVRLAGRTSARLSCEAPFASLRPG